MIGLASDRPRAGKSTAADYLVLAHGFQSVSIGDAVKHELDVMLRAHGFKYEEKSKDELRPALSWWTEFRIKNCSQDYWLDQVVRTLTSHDSVVVPDVRYPNEADYIKANGGIVVKVQREILNRSNLPSEMALDGYQFDQTLDNSRNDDGEAMFKDLDKIVQNRMSAA